MVRAGPNAAVGFRPVPGLSFPAASAVIWMKLAGRLTVFSSREPKSCRPRTIKKVDSFGRFAFLDSDRRRSIRGGVQSRHLAAIENADFLYLVCPDGYTGQSTCLELGYALSSRTPILASDSPGDDTVKQYVNQICRPGEAVDWLSRQRRNQVVGRGLILLNSEETIAAVHAGLENAERDLTTNRYRSGGDPAEGPIRLARRLLELPGY